MKKALRLLALISVIVFALVSCDDNQQLIINQTTPTPTIRGTVSIPEGSGFTGSDFFIRIMEGEKAVYTGRVNADGSFSVPGLSEEATYSILLTTEEPGDIKGTEKDISRATTTSGMGGWLSNVTASINEQAGVGSVKVKPLGTIKGVVTKDGATDGYDTTVYIPGTSYLAMTDGEGNFSIFNVPQATYTLRCISHGYMAKMVNDVVLYSDSDTENPVKEVEPQILIKNAGTLVGNITKTGSTDHSNITVMLSDGENVYTGSTATGGSLMVTGIIPGTYIATISSSGFVTQTVEEIKIEAAKNTTLNPISMIANGGTITGSVVMNDGREKAGVLITAKSSDNKYSYTASTDAEGMFTIPNAYPETYTLTLTKANYAIITQTGIQSIAGQTTNVGEFSFSSDFGTIEGIVTDTKGNPIENAIVRIGEIIVNTDSEGQFSKTGIVIGNYTVTVSKDGYTTKTLDGNKTIESSQTSSTGTIELASIYGSISGTVTVNDDRTVEGIHISAVSNDNTNSYSTLTKADGTYSLINVATGTYTITAKQAGYSDLSETVNVVADTNAVVPTIGLISKYGSVSGKVALAESPDNSGITVTLKFVADSTIVPATISGADGTYTFSNLTNAGQYSLILSKDGYVSSTGTIVNVTLGQNTTVDDITLRSLASKVSGKATLEGTEDYTGVSVLLKATDDSRQYDATTDQQGNYVMARVNPGEYTLTVSKTGYVSKTVSDIIVESSTEKTLDNVSLNIGTRSVSGNVTLELKSDYSGALISATNLSNPKDVYSAISNTAGDYTLAGMKPGEYVISVSCAGYNTATLPTINITDGKETTLDSFELKIARGTISGTTTLEGRGTNAGVTVELLKGTDVYTTTTTDDSGAYAFNVPQGNYSGVRLSCENFKSVSISQSIALIANDYVTMGEEGVAVIMEATHVPVVRGRLTVKNLLSLDYSNIAVTLVENGMTTTTDKDGYWSFAKVPVGHYTLKFERENTNPVTMAVDIVAAAEKNIETIELIPNAASIEGNVTLNGLTDYSGITVRATAEGMAELLTKTNAAGYFYIGNVVTTETYTVHFEKAGWESQTRQISGLEDLSINDITEANPVKLMDTTAPVLNSISVTVGNSELEGRKLNVYINAVEEGSGISKVYVNTTNDFTNVEPINYSNPLSCYVEDTEGNYTLYVKVEDKSNNQSTVTSQAFSIADYKTIVSGVILDNEDGVDDGIVTWSKNKSPYYVTGNLLVDENTTLIIEPGVNVQFSGAYYIQVEGTLKINGTENEKVYLYGVGDGENTWTGINGVKDNGNELHFAVLTGMAQGVKGYVRVSDSTLTARSSGYALGSEGLLFRGIVEECSITGRLYIHSATLLKNLIHSTYDATRMNFYSNKDMIMVSFLSGNELEGVGFYLYASSGENNLFDSTKVMLDQSGMVNGTFRNSTVNMKDGGLYSKCVFEDCIFDDFFPAIVKDSNIIDCGTIKVTSNRTNYEKLDLTGNYWGVNNTAELNAHGVNYNHTFLVDYYDDFNVTLLDVSDYATTAYEGIGYLGDAYYPETIESTTVYTIGSTGPAGGIVFYDKGYYSEGWRYLEVAPTDLATGFPFGGATYNSGYQLVGTGFSIGSGKNNTLLLVERIGEKTGSYAAKICYDYILNGYDDWFLPSRDELNLMYVNLHKAGLGGFASYYYWSSSEESYYSNNAWRQNFGSGDQDNYGRNYNLRVRPVRAF